jgi:hypothetical protein
MSQHDFDFVFGRWNVHNARLAQPLAGSNDWNEFPAMAEEMPLLDGLANLERYEAPLAPQPIHAIAIRLYDAASQCWSILWTTAGSGEFGTPTIGRFNDGKGIFVAHELLDDRPIVVRFIWTHDGSDRCRWEQAFSADDGATWETNWTMDFTRASA